MYTLQETHARLNALLQSSQGIELVFIAAPERLAVIVLSGAYKGHYEVIHNASLVQQLRAQPHTAFVFGSKGQLLPTEVLNTTLPVTSAYSDTYLSTVARNWRPYGVLSHPVPPTLFQVIAHELNTTSFELFGVPSHLSSRHA